MTRGAGAPVEGISQVPAVTMRVCVRRVRDSEHALGLRGGTVSERVAGVGSRGRDACAGRGQQE